MSISPETYWRSMASGMDRGLTAGILTLLLAIPSLLYSSVLALRAMLYQSGLFKVRRLPKPVISIGNITVGGTGKTPVTALIARMLLERGLKVAVLSRGYGGSMEGACAVVSDGQNLFLEPGQCGDEPYLLADTLPGLMVVIGADRYQAGTLALERLAPDIFLLDDGFQHLRLHRDLNILLLDCQNPFGNGYTLPAGLLREPKSALQRADLAIQTRCTPASSVTALYSIPCCRSTHRLSSFHHLDNGTELDVTTLNGKRIAAFAGIADPAGFFSSLEQSGIRLVAGLHLPDHEPYGISTQERLHDLLHDQQIDLLVTTEKDGVKLRSADKNLISRIITARLEIVLEDDSLLRQALDDLLPRRNDTILNLLACPSCNRPLEFQEHRRGLFCRNCGLAFPMREGIPVLLIDEATEAGGNRQ